MRIAQMSNNRPGAKGLAEQNYHKKDENKDTRGGVTGEGQDLSEEDERRIHEYIEGTSDGQMAIQVQDCAPTQALMPRSQPQPKESVVRWERFLPVRSLKVLLVESDDSTRHVVSALLRNCGYEVTNAANGWQAWKILEDITNHIDLVLTEVSVPLLSGVALLSKIMRHKTLKNIPVIMMSSHDTMGIVFKCLSKGAVDFLVKPIRKNELKNLWQHVWRKCHSSSGSGSESGIQTQKSNKLKSGKSDNNSGSNDEDDIESVGLNARDGSDNGSGTQSSWTKRAIEIDSPQRMSTWDQLADPPDSTCAQVIHLRPEAFSSNWVPVNATRDFEGQDAEIDNDVMGKDLEIGVPGNANPQTEEPTKEILATSYNPDKDSEIDCKRNEDQLNLKSEKTQSESQNKAVDLLGSIAINTDPQIEILDFNNAGGLSKAPDGKDKTMYDDKEMPCLDLSLKRTRDVQDIEKSDHDWNILRHSDLSAFSKYSSAPPSNQAPTAIVGSCSPVANSSEAAKTESVQNLQSNSNSPPPNQGSNGGSNGSGNNNDMGSTTNDAVKGHHPSSAFQPVDSSRKFTPHPAAQGGNKVDVATSRMTPGQSRDANQHVLSHSNHHHHHYHMISDNDDTSNATSLQCGSSNVLVEGHAANHSLNGSDSGSNHASNNGWNGSSTPSNTQEIDPNGNNKMAANCGAGMGIGRMDRNITDQNRNAQREAALNKFRQKRKERCFEKKVRYYSRKKLAEQRPRIRGQFVRQNANKVKDPS
ncbi:two-component response regulator-like PRR37 isoform X2 [Punica granatum]|uniref:Two-component response regulator-like PRR37 isoform X2 n=1 Tax=Punica granatum TaxID=22663 RepID=A0A6P8CI99_PUNGR|nr:two-component response regulator-like PRR37 isoform X2 [Punica granatum]